MAEEAPEETPLPLEQSLDLLLDYAPLDEFPLVRELDDGEVDELVAFSPPETSPAEEKQVSDEVDAVVKGAAAQAPPGRDR